MATKKRRYGLQMMKDGEKKRNVGCIIFVEQLEKAEKTYWDLLAHLDGLCVKAVCSPVHDKDQYTAEDVRNWVERHLDPETGRTASEYSEKEPKVGDPKKAHVHIGFKLTRQLTREECSEILLGAFIDYPPTRWAVIPDWDSYCAYMCHKFNPNKAWYDPASVMGFGGVDLTWLRKGTKIDEIMSLSNLMDQIDELGFRYVHQVYVWARGTGDGDVIELVQSKASFIHMMLQSKRTQRLDEKAAKQATGAQGSPDD